MPTPTDETTEETTDETTDEPDNGEAQPSPDAAIADPQTETADAPQPDDDLERLRSELAQATADADKWKQQSRKHEARSKARTPREEVDAAIAEAKADAAAEMRASTMRRVATAETRAALAAANPAAVGLADWVDTAQLLDANGDLDAEKVANFMEVVKPLVGHAPTIMSQGVQPADGVGQLARDDLRGKSPRWIEEQRTAGRLSTVLRNST